MCWSLKWPRRACRRGMARGSRPGQRATDKNQSAPNPGDGLPSDAATAQPTKGPGMKGSVSKTCDIEIVSSFCACIWVHSGVMGRPIPDGGEAPREEPDAGADGEAPAPSHSSEGESSDGWVQDSDEEQDSDSDDSDGEWTGMRELLMAASDNDVRVLTQLLSQPGAEDLINQSMVCGACWGGSMHGAACGDGNGRPEGGLSCGRMPSAHAARALPCHLPFLSVASTTCLPRHNTPAPAGQRRRHSTTPGGLVRPRRLRHCPSGGRRAGRRARRRRLHPRA